MSALRSFFEEKKRCEIRKTKGAIWLEADCNLISGEDMIRQFLFGKRFFRSEFGVDCLIYDK